MNATTVAAALLAQKTEPSFDVGKLLVLGAIGFGIYLILKK
jgi:hypothetical protein